MARRRTLMINQPTGQVSQPSYSDLDAGGLMVNPQHGGPYHHAGPYLVAMEQPARRTWHEFDYIQSDCEAGVHRKPTKHTLIRRPVSRLTDVRQRVTLTHSDPDCSGVHMTSSYCRRRHSIHGLDQSVTSPLRRRLPPLFVQQQPEDGIHPNTSCSQSVTSQSSGDDSSDHVTDPPPRHQPSPLHHQPSPRLKQPALHQPFPLHPPPSPHRQASQQPFPLHPPPSPHGQPSPQTDSTNTYISAKTNMLELIEADLKLKLELQMIKDAFIYTLEGFEMFESQFCHPISEDTRRQPKPPLQTGFSDCGDSLSSKTLSHHHLHDFLPRQSLESIHQDSILSSEMLDPPPSLISAGVCSLSRFKSHLEDPQPLVPHQSLADSGTDITTSNTTSSGSRCPTTSDGTCSSFDRSLSQKKLMESPRYNTPSSLYSAGGSERKPRRFRSYREDGSKTVRLEKLGKGKKVEYPLQSTLLYPQHSTPEATHSRRRLMLEESHISKVSDLSVQDYSSEKSDLSIRRLSSTSEKSLENDDCNNNSKGQDRSSSPHQYMRPSPLEHFLVHNPSFKRRHRRKRSTKRPSNLPSSESRESPINQNYFFASSSAESTPVAIRSKVWSTQDLLFSPSGRAYDSSEMIGSPTLVATPDDMMFPRTFSRQTSSMLQNTSARSVSNPEIRQVEPHIGAGEYFTHYFRPGTLLRLRNTDDLHHQSAEELSSLASIPTGSERKMRRQTGQTELYNIQAPIGLSEADLVESTGCAASKGYCSIEATRDSVPDLSSVSTPPSSYRENSSSSCYYKDSSYKESDGMCSPPKSTDSIDTGPSIPKAASGADTTSFWSPSQATSSDSYGGFIPPRNSPDSTKQDFSLLSTSNADGDGLHLQVRPPCIGAETTRGGSTPSILLTPTDTQGNGDSSDSSLHLSLLPSTPISTPPPTTPTSRLGSTEKIRRSISKRFKTLGKSLLKRPFKKNPSDGSS